MSDTLRTVTQFVLILSIGLGVHNLYVCTKAAMKKPLKINYVQVVASVFQLMNQACLLAFFILDSRKYFNGQCKFLQDIDFAIFFIFVALTIGVLIIRTTILIDEKYQLYVKGFLFMALAVALGAATHASMNRVVFVDNNGRCGAIWYKPSNTLQVCTNLFIYTCCFGIFIVPASKYYLSSIGHAKNSLREVIFSVAFRIAVAMLGFLISAIFALTGVWGMAFEIQFSFENYCAIVASTYAIKKDGTASDQQNSTTKKSMVSKA